MGNGGDSSNQRLLEAAAAPAAPVAASRPLGRISADDSMGGFFRQGAGQGPGDGGREGETEGIFLERARNMQFFFYFFKMI